jgi:hypothetical protein
MIIGGALACGAFAACDAPMHVIDTSERVEATGGGGASHGSGGAGGGCDVPSDGGARTGDAREVRDMTHAEATAWCNNYISNIYTGGRAPDMQSIFPGYVENGQTNCESVDACVVASTLDDCVKNLLHAPCEATISQLNTCVASMLDNDDACGSACGPFMNAPHCSETVVSKAGPPIPGGGGGGLECYLRTSQGCR